MISRPETYQAVGLIDPMDYAKTCQRVDEHERRITENEKMAYNTALTVAGVTSKITILVVFMTVAMNVVGGVIIYAITRGLIHPSLPTAGGP